MTSLLPAGPPPLPYKIDFRSRRIAYQLDNASTLVLPRVSKKMPRSRLRLSFIVCFFLSVTKGAGKPPVLCDDVTRWTSVNRAAKAAASDTSNNSRGLTTVPLIKLGLCVRVGLTFSVLKKKKNKKRRVNHHVAVD